MRIAYANGCSMTYGSELCGEETYVLEQHLSPSQNAHRKHHAWPGVLGRMLGAEATVNNGFGGASNDRIHRTVISDIVALKLGPQDFVSIGWTETERFEYMSPAHWVQQTVNVRPSWYAEKQFVDDWARLMLSDVNKVWERFLTQVLTVQAMLRERSIPYVMFNALPAITIDNYPPIPTSCKHLLNAIDLTKWVTPIDRMPECMFCQIKHLPQGPSLHPLEEGHQLWGTIVHDFISRTYPQLAKAA